MQTSKHIPGLLGLVLMVLLLLAATPRCARLLAQPSSGRGQVGRPVSTGRSDAVPAQAATFHVATDGNDDSDGSLAAPWRTLQHAVERAEPGDTILVRAGTFAGARIERSGTAAAWITLQAAAGALVTIDRPGPGNRHGSNLEVETWEGDGSVAYWVIQGFEVSGAPSWGIDMRGDASTKSHHIIVRDNRVHHNGIATGRTGIFAAFVDDLTVQGNESYANGEHGLYVNNSSDRFVVQGNRLYDNAACGLHLNGDLSQGGDGILSHGLVEGNIIYDNGRQGGAAINMDGVTDSIVRNNLLHNNHATGVALFQGDGAVCSRRNRILHNTIQVAADGRWAVLVGGVGCVDNQVVNNILLSQHATRGSINLMAHPIEGFYSDYNVVVDRFTADDGDAVVALAGWQALGHGAHSFVAQPAELFIDAMQDNYRLRPGSPAIDAGSDQAQVSRDLEGVGRPSGEGYDIGAFEALEGSQTYLPLVIR